MLLFEVLLYHWYVGPEAVVTTETVEVEKAVFKQVLCAVVLGWLVIDGAELTVIVAAPELTFEQEAVFTIALNKVVVVKFKYGYVVDVFTIVVQLVPPFSDFSHLVMLVTPTEPVKVKVAPLLPLQTLESEVTLPAPLDISSAPISDGSVLDSPS